MTLRHLEPGFVSSLNVCSFLRVVSLCNAFTASLTRDTTTYWFRLLGHNQNTHTYCLLLTYTQTQLHTVIILLATNGLSERSVAYIYGNDQALSESNGLLCFVAVEMFYKIKICPHCAAVLSQVYNANGFTGLQP